MRQTLFWFGGVGCGMMIGGEPIVVVAGGTFATLCAVGMIYLDHFRRKPYRF